MKREISQNNHIKQKKNSKMLRLSFDRLFNRNISLVEQLVDYADGTPASAAQMAKDVVTFLSWVADRSLEDRKQIGLKALPILCIMFAGSWYATRFVFKPLKTTKFEFISRIRKQKF